MVARVVKGADLRPAGFGRVGSNPTPCNPAPIAQLVERGAYNRCYVKVRSYSHYALDDTPKSWVRAPLGALKS